MSKHNKIWNDQQGPKCILVDGTSLESFTSSESSTYGWGYIFWNVNNGCMRVIPVPMCGEPHPICSAQICAHSYLSYCLAVYLGKKKSNDCKEFFPSLNFQSMPSFIIFFTELSSFKIHPHLRNCQRDR